MARRVTGAAAQPMRSKPRADQQVPVALAALIQRINRALAKQEEALVKTRGARAVAELGEYYTVNVRDNYLVSKDVDPEGLGRELAVLKPWEKVVS